MSSAREDQGRENPAQDELLARYQQASVLDNARPGPQVREAVLAHARAMAASASAPASDAPSRAHDRPPREASNSPSWRMQALGSLAVIGLAGVLYLQFDRGSQEEREAAFGVGSRSVTPPVVGSAPAATVDGATTARPPAGQSGIARAEVSKPLGPSVDTSGRPTPQGEQSSPNRIAAGPVAPATAPPAAAPVATQESATPKTAALAPVPTQSAIEERVALQGQPQAQARDAAKPAAELAKASAAQPLGADAVRAPALAAPAPALAQAPARARAAAPATAQAADASGSDAMGARREASDAAAPAQALRQAALAGDLARIEALLVRGAPLESVDDAGRTPLLLAVMQGQRAAVARLLAAGANARTQDRDGVSALRHAQSRAFVEIEALLRQHGAN